MNAQPNIPLSEQWYHAARAYEDAEAAASMLEQCRTAVRSEMMMALGEMPVSKAEMRVNASPEWREYNEKMVEARKQANLLRVERDFLRMRFSENMSREADHRLVARA